MNKPCYFDKSKIINCESLEFCAYEPKVKTNWEHCSCGKLSDGYKNQAKSAKIKKISDAIWEYLACAHFRKININARKGARANITKIIKKHL